MGKTLGGSLFIRNGEKYDYCYKEAIACLKEFCDKVVVVEVGSDDGTQELVKQFSDSKTSIINLPSIMWDLQQGRQKLSYFSNIAHSMLDTDWFFYLQGDEILHESCYDSVRKAIEIDNQAYMVSRINLWRDCNHQLNVTQDRKPVSTEIIRLAKRGAYSYDDAESLAVPSLSMEFVNDIRVYHYGFVRKKEVHPAKIKQMFEDIFLMSNDARVEAMNGVFDPYAFFSDEDLIPIIEDHPKLMKNWVLERP